MFIHTVMWNLKNDTTRVNDFQQAKEQLLALKSQIPELLEIEIGKAENKATDEYTREVTLITKFKNQEDYAVYRDHEKHLEVKKYLATIFEARVVSDIEI